jgi:hypothetical protein
MSYIFIPEGNDLHIIEGDTLQATSRSRAVFNRIMQSLSGREREEFLGAAREEIVQLERGAWCGREERLLRQELQEARTASERHRRDAYAWREENRRLQGLLRQAGRVDVGEAQRLRRRLRVQQQRFCELVMELEAVKEVAAKNQDEANLLDRSVVRLGKRVSNLQAALRDRQPRAAA